MLCCAIPKVEGALAEFGPMVVDAQGDVAALGGQLAMMGEMSGRVQLDAETLLRSCESFCEEVRRWRSTPRR
jgi:hypothetical protein